MNDEHQKRNMEQQKIHDNIIYTLQSNLIKQDFNVRINPNQKKEYGVIKNNLEIYPDLYTYTEDNVDRIYEVETSETINLDSLKNQWQIYSEGKSKFYLVVPKKDLEKVKKLCNENGVEVEGFLTF